MKIVVKNMRQHLIELQQYFAPYFQNLHLNMVSSECLEDKSSTKLSSYITYYADPAKVSTIIREKIPNFNKEEYFIELGVDGGKNNLKICLNWRKRTKDNRKYQLTRSSGHSAPLLLAPAEGSGALRALLGAFGPLFIIMKLYFESEFPFFGGGYKTF